MIINRMKEFLGKNWDSPKYKEGLLKNKTSLYIALIFSLILLMIPSVFLSEEIIKNNDAIKAYIEYFSSFFSSIESKAMIAKDNNLYYFSKLETLIAAIVILFVFLIFIFPLSKVYLCSLNIIQCEESKYINSTIKKYKSFTSCTEYLIHLLTMLIFIKMFFYGSYSLDSFRRLDYLYNTEIGIMFTALFHAFTIGFLLSFLLLESMAKLYKFFNYRDKKFR